MIRLTSLQAREAFLEAAFVVVGEVRDADGVIAIVTVTETEREMIRVEVPSAELGAADLEVLLVNLEVGAT